MDAARMQDPTETRLRHTRFAHPEMIKIETELLGLRLRAREEI